ncbi:expressed unknown protein [Seminavis robusta]|uniref:Uncharacterized protein n=1 Tax=Seminavis robusta TaxID=568900 RepID=A0A9N8EIZ0_9STRA|nr:expressed unknown protein [Seminavis robusta]|eukprot:Sro1010_g230870.1 n/a (251) ;mRNA; r:18168-18920
MDSSKHSRVSMDSSATVRRSTRSGKKEAQRAFQYPSALRPASRKKMPSAAPPSRRVDVDDDDMFPPPSANKRMTSPARRGEANKKVPEEYPPFLDNTSNNSSGGIQGGHPYASQTRVIGTTPPGLCEFRRVASSRSIASVSTKGSVTSFRGGGRLAREASRASIWSAVSNTSSTCELAQYNSNTKKGSMAKLSSFSPASSSSSNSPPRSNMKTYQRASGVYPNTVGRNTVFGNRPSNPHGQELQEDDFYY